MAEYDVLLQYPDYDKPNAIELLDEHGKVLFKSGGLSKVFFPEEQGDKRGPVRWNAYSGCELNTPVSMTTIQVVN